MKFSDIVSTILCSLMCLLGLHSHDDSCAYCGKKVKE
jgi:hypothetical protein